MSHPWYSSVWVVEMLIGERRGIQLWAPTDYTYTLKRAAERLMSEVKAENPADKFRLRKYIRSVNA